MPFLKDLNQTAPQGDRELPWPMNGLAYVAAFMGPMAAGPMVGVASNDWLAGLFGFVLGVGISLLNGWLCDKYVDPIIARHQKTLLKPAIQILANMAAFVWAFLVSALAMLCPLAIFGQRALQ